MISISHRRGFEIQTDWELVQHHTAPERRSRIWAKEVWTSARNFSRRATRLWEGVSLEEARRVPSLTHSPRAPSRLLFRENSGILHHFHHRWFPLPDHGVALYLLYLWWVGAFQTSGFCFMTENAGCDFRDTSHLWFNQIPADRNIYIPKVDTAHSWSCCKSHKMTFKSQ